MKRKIGSLILGLLLLVAGLGVSSKVAADSINYQALKYGSQQQSIASSYYVKPASVTVNGDQYLVTMTIRTGAQLGEWPVTVLSIDGHGPANVSKVKNGSNYDYSYAFETNDLSQVVSSSISIDVPNVYTAKHDISFQFDTSNLPALNSATNSSSASSASSSSSAVSSSSSVASSTSASSQSVTSQPTTSAKASDKRAKQQAAQIAALNKKNEQTQVAIMIGGSLVLVVLAVAAYFFVRQK
ncbi:NEAT domain-containing protein [Loigolactobacillus zhaoyuanensis]|uniref:NEAT domain-containing protein n=1 Tax=Loigolactobacillus zhaoyuanensis TaxID=2486017 RepID=UPI000F74BC60|nr:NEAT domain-containing protein [Loigolactobacillus zhaoyuanensis]